MNKAAAAVVIVFLLGLVVICTNAKSAEICENGVFSEQKTSFEEAGAVVTKLNVDQIESMISKVGRPPNTEGDFDAYLVVNSPLAAVFVVQEGCTKARLGPSREDSINSLLGIVKAKAQGERVD